jgi:hypothetical protein
MPVIPTVSSFGEALWVGLTALLAGIIAFLPGLLAAVLLLVGGWILSGIVGRLAETLLNRFGFEQAATRAGISGFMSRTGNTHLNASRLLSELVKWFIRLLAIDLAANAVGLLELVRLINRVVLWLPNLFLAIVILMLGILLGRFAARMVRGVAAEAGIGAPEFLGTLTQYALVGFALVVALNQVGIAGDLLTIVFAGILGGAALGIAIAFGLGGSEVAADLWRGGASAAGQLGRTLATDGGRREDMAGMPEPSAADAHGTGPQGAPPVGVEQPESDL